MNSIKVNKSLCWLLQFSKDTSLPYLNPRRHCKWEPHLVPCASLKNWNWRATQLKAVPYKSYWGVSKLTSHSPPISQGEPPFCHSVYAIHNHFSAFQNNMNMASSEETCIIALQTDIVLHMWGWSWRVLSWLWWKTIMNRSLRAIEECHWYRKDTEWHNYG